MFVVLTNTVVMIDPTQMLEDGYPILTIILVDVYYLNIFSNVVMLLRIIVKLLFTAFTCLYGCIKRRTEQS